MDKDLTNIMIEIILNGTYYEKRKTTVEILLLTFLVLQYNCCGNNFENLLV
jgi:hypothetical protein